MSNDSRSIPDIYTDSVQVSINIHSVNITFSLSDPHPGIGESAPEEKACVRMSLQHAKLLAAIINQALKNYEDATGLPIKLPQGMYEDLGLAAEDC